MKMVAAWQNPFFALNNRNNGGQWFLDHRSPAGGCQATSVKHRKIDGRKSDCDFQGYEELGSPRVAQGYLKRARVKAKYHHCESNPCVTTLFRL